VQGSSSKSTGEPVKIARDNFTLFVIPDERELYFLSL
jgi:hypothetical protein